MAFRNGAGAHAIAYSPDGKHLVSSSTEGVVIASSESGAVEHSFDAYKFGEQLAWSPDGSQIAIANNGALVLVSASGVVDWTVEWGLLGSQTIGDLAWSPDGERLAVATSPRGAWLVDVRRRTKSQLALAGKDVADVAWSRDARSLALRSGDTIEIVDAASGRSIARVTTPEVTDLRFGAAGELWVLEERQLRRFDVATQTFGEHVATTIDHGHALAVSDDGALVAFGDDAGAALLDVASGRVRELDPRDTPAHRLAFSRDGRRLAAAAIERLQQGQVTTWDVVSGRAVARDGHRAAIDAVACTRDTIITADRDDLRLWNLDGTARAVIGRFATWSVAVSPDGRALQAVHGSRDRRRLAAFELPSGRPLDPFTVVDDVRGAGYLNDGRLVILHGNELLVVRDGRLEHRIALEIDGAIDELLVGPDNRVVAVTGFRFAWLADLPGFTNPRVAHFDDVLYTVFDFAGDDRTLYAFTDSERIAVDTRDLSQHRTELGFSRDWKYRGLRYSADRSWFVGPIQDDRLGAPVSIGRSRTMERVAALVPSQRYSDRGSAYAICPGETRVVVGYHTGVALVWSR